MFLSSSFSLLPSPPFSLISFSFSSRYQTLPNFSSSYISSLFFFAPYFSFFLLYLQFPFIFIFSCINIFFILKTFYSKNSTAMCFHSCPFVRQEIQFPFISCNSAMIMALCTGRSLSDIFLVDVGSFVHRP